MNQRHITFLLLVVLVCLVGGIFFLQNQKTLVTHKEPGKTNTNNTEPQEVETADTNQMRVAGNQASASEHTTQPNVLLVILDDIGLDYFPGYLQEQNFTKAPMPVIETLMDQSFVFTGLHTYSMCSPTRASLLSGVHGVETGVLDAGRMS